jgi:hypothetical protein
MWSRDVEIMLGCWLLVSPFIFGHPAGEILWWITDFSAGLAVIVLGLLSYWRKTRHAHLGTFLVGGMLIAVAYAAAGRHEAPAVQNQAVLGLLLLMFALIPNEASQPPLSVTAASEGAPEAPAG